MTGWIRQTCRKVINGQSKYGKLLPLAGVVIVFCFINAHYSDNRVIIRNHKDDFDTPRGEKMTFQSDVIYESSSDIPSVVAAKVKIPLKKLSKKFEKSLYHQNSVKNEETKSSSSSSQQDSLQPLVSNTVNLVDKLVKQNGNDQVRK